MYFCYSSSSEKSCLKLSTKLVAVSLTVLYKGIKKELSSYVVLGTLFTLDIEFPVETFPVLDIPLVLEMLPVVAILLVVGISLIWEICLPEGICLCVDA
jgi:hypothetical protein